MNHFPDLKSENPTDTESIYLFVRTEDFYPLNMRNDEEAIANARCNPGTFYVQHASSGRIVFTCDQ